jgi:hypothetical protein
VARATEPIGASCPDQKTLSGSWGVFDRLQTIPETYFDAYYGLGDSLHAAPIDRNAATTQQQMSAAGHEDHQLQGSSTPHHAAPRGCRRKAGPAAAALYFFPPSQPGPRTGAVTVNQQQQQHQQHQQQHLLTTCSTTAAGCHSSRIPQQKTGRGSTHARRHCPAARELHAGP